MKFIQYIKSSLFDIMPAGLFIYANEENIRWLILTLQISVYWSTIVASTFLLLIIYTSTKFQKLIRGEKRPKMVVLFQDQNYLLFRWNIEIGVVIMLTIYNYDIMALFFAVQIFMWIMFVDKVNRLRKK